MIRRGFWLAVGAAGGIMGYRRAVALSRRVSGSLSGRRETAAGRRAPSRSLLRDAVRATRAARSIAGDVREGMELYMARRPGSAPPTLPGSAHGGGQRRLSAEPHNAVTEKDDR
jgi:hypothetical protein